MTNLKELTILGSREVIRKKIFEKFRDEPPHSGEYKYIVESIDDITIYLIRPTILNKGIDFAIHLENFEFRNKNKKGHKGRQSPL